MPCGGSGPEVPTYPADLLQLTTGAAIRVVAAACLDDAVVARARLTTNDPEAFHDFRVAIRRLRSHLRAFATRLPRAAALRPRLKALQLATNHGRDLEVQLAWVARARARLPSVRERAGVGAIILQLERDQTRAVASGLRHIEADFPALELELRRSLSVPSPTPTGGCAALLTELCSDLSRRLQRRLSEVKSLEQVDEPHAARIAAKRLRYLLETVAGLSPPAAAMVRTLKGLQDLLGDLHDVQLMAQRLERLGRRLTRGRVSKRAAVTALHRRAEREIRRLFHRLEADWLSPPASARFAVRLKRLRGRLGA
jgi:CHAD domain-containing protein